MPIQLAFQDEKIRAICESPVSAKRRLGKAAGLTLLARLADLRAASSPQDLIDLGLAKLSLDEIRVVIQLDAEYFVHAAANHLVIPRKSGKVDWRSVSRIKILCIERSNET